MKSGIRVFCSEQNTLRGETRTMKGCNYYGRIPEGCQ